MSDPTPAGTELFKNLNSEKQERVFHAAVQEFASQGYRNASMNNLVEAAGISKGSLFKYFKTKGDLFDGVVNIATGRVKHYLKQVQEETRAMAFFDRLEKLLRSGFAFIDTHPLLARIYFRLLQSGEAPFGSERILALHRMGDEFIVDLIHFAMDRGELRPELDAPRVAFLVSAVFERLLRAYYIEFVASGLGLYRADQDELDRWVRTTLDLIRDGMAKH